MYGEAGIINYVHGNKNRLMKKEEYNSIKTAATIEDLKIKLQNTIYGKSLLEDSATTHKAFKEALYQCVDKQIKMTQAFTTEKSKTLIDFYKEKFQLDNFIYLWACKEESPKTLETALDIHPLGTYPELNFIKVTQTAKDTWKFCLENTPLCKYIVGLSHEILKEDVQYVRSILQKRYIELLYEYSKKNNLILSELVLFEGDKRIIEILYSTVGTTMSAREKECLFPACSTFSDIHKDLLLNCKSIDELQGVLSTHSNHRNIVGNERGLEDALIREEVRICNKSFYVYDDPSVVYTQLTLQELEVRNLIFMADCIIQGYKDHADQIVDINGN
ncbi:V-type H+-transporting ATPase subunit d [Nematocida minor]|uniref:V-type H+-transporting ATPase subunit d n=1 Tax=Nematocida minor TaxID=1912983 RepID=UPI00221E6A4D|nr:V-type H+-transporting ATPase subunit d [Nematocida minor]KAI5189867.1 V-type H+-transporting ATPase subunit d [Nematocida minor]